MCGVVVRRNDEAYSASFISFVRIVGNISVVLFIASSGRLKTIRMKNKCRSHSSIPIAIGT